jgi:hypothetical protein
MIVFSCEIAGAVLRISSCNSWLFVCIQNRNKRTIAIRPYITVIHKLRTNWLFERLHRPLTLMNKLRDLDLYLIIRCIQRSCPSAILIIFKPKKTPPTRQQSCRAPENGIIYLKTRFPLTVSILITVMQNEVLFDGVFLLSGSDATKTRLFQGKLLQPNLRTPVLSVRDENNFRSYVHYP